ESAVESAVSRACSWEASPAPAESIGGGGGMTAIWALSESSSPCCSRTFELAERNIIESIALTRTTPTTPTSTGTLVLVRLLSSRGRRLTARISVLDPESDGDGERADLVRLLEALVHLAERAGDGDAEVLAAPLEHARELADAAVRDGEGRAVVADGDGDDGRLRGAGLGRRREGAQERERLEIDADEGDTGLAARHDVAVD